MRAVCFPSLAATFVTLGVALGGCAQPTPVDSVESSETHAFLRVERTVAAGPEAQKLEGRAAASFLRTVHPGAERPLVAARLVGALLDVPRESGCVPRLASQPSVALRTLSPVDLVPARVISVQRIVGEFEDRALLTTFGRGGLGIFPAPVLLAEQVANQLGAQPLGEMNGVSEQIYAISNERRIRHPAVEVLCAASPQGTPTPEV